MEEWTHGAGDWKGKPQQRREEGITRFQFLLLIEKLDFERQGGPWLFVLVEDPHICLAVEGI